MSDTQKMFADNVSQNDDTKNKVTSLEIIVRMIDNKPYYDVKTTNTDRIRNMSDEELASVLFDSCIESMNLEECPYSSEESDNNKIRERCKKCILEWLQSEVK